ncbi:MAG TPA: DUF2935 domain-containing protein [Symbiobacteriaceae bacterium]|nr:DUF2935 domain-containing protein [Symbiobacteriaceae bacterium]
MAQVTAADHAFWLQVMEEHGIFLYDHLSPRESLWIRQTTPFIDAFARLKRAAATATGPMPPAFLQEALQVSRQFYTYKLALMKQRINNEVVLNFTPAFLNGVISELEEYLRLLTPLAEGQEPAPVTPFHHIYLWLPDQIGHASLLAKDLDLLDREITRETVQYQTAFTEDYLGFIQLAGYARAMGTDFPRLELEVEGLCTRLQAFYKVVVRALGLLRTDRLYNRTSPLFLEHHFAETAYFLRKLAESFPALAARRPELFLPPQSPGA